MAIFTIHKGKHRATPFYWLRWWPLLVDPSRINRKVLFPFDAKYKLGDGDQDDHNKLFGFAYAGGVHRNSARFGWRYNPTKNVFIISAYLYVNGERQMHDLCECVANHPYWFEILVKPNGRYLFRVTDEKFNLIANEWFTTGKRTLLAFLLGPYFGGNQSAPDTLKLEIEK